jgi:hypothetical protein
MSRISRPATAAEIIEIVGPLDDSVLMRIVDRGDVGRGTRSIHLGNC